MNVPEGESEYETEDEKYVDENGEIRIRKVRKKVEKDIPFEIFLKGKNSLELKMLR